MAPNTSPDPHMERIRAYVIDRLRREVREGERGTQSRIARELGIATAHIANLLSDPPSRKPGEKLCRMAARRWGMSYGELEAEASRGLVAEREAQQMGRSDRKDPPISTFLLKLDRLPGLRQWIEDTRSDLTVTQIATGIAEYETSVYPRSREDAQPVNGWEAFFSDVLAGRLSGPRKRGDQELAEVLEYGELPPATRARVKAPAKRKP